MHRPGPFLERPRPSGRSKSRNPTRTASALWSCLVLSPSDERLREFARSAEEAEWYVLAATRAAEAAVLAARTSFRLGIFDFARGVSPEERSEIQALIERLPSTETLSAVCGGDDPELETWARQAGIWLFAPEVEHPSDLVGVWDEARGVALKLHPEWADLEARSL
jgi:hypothetical protein